MSIMRFTRPIAQYIVANAIKDEIVNLEPCQQAKGHNLNLCKILHSRPINQFVHNHYNCPTQVANCMQSILISGLFGNLEEELKCYTLNSKSHQ